MDDFLELVARYDVRAPRYTSYPTAASFHRGVGSREYAAAIRSTNRDAVPAPLSIYLHLPYCKSLCYYCACTKVVTRNLAKVRRYRQRLVQEAMLVGPLVASDRQVRYLHLGGGTPSYASPQELAELLAELAEHFHFASPDEREWAIEIDPRTVAPEDIGALRAAGFNRLSFGIQDFDPEVQAAINRVQPLESVRELVAAARDAAFQSLNFDLVYGLPRQTGSGFAHTLDQVAELHPDRVALYGYAHLPQRFPAQRLIRDEDLPRGMDKLALLVSAIRTLGASGYIPIGMDHFSRPSDALAKARVQGSLVRNFQGYAPGPSPDLIGLGASSISSLGGLYAQNIKSVVDWEEAVGGGKLATDRGYALSADDRLRRDAIEAVMCRDEVRYDEFETRYGIDFREYFRPALARLEQAERDGLVRRGDSALHITPLGRLFLRAIAMVFDNFLAEQPPGASGVAAYSRVV